jgi:hypothetical protein
VTLVDGLDDPDAGGIPVWAVTLTRDLIVRVELGSPAGVVAGDLPVAGAASLGLALLDCYDTAQDWIGTDAQA